MAFAFIDVSFTVSQHLQMLSIKHYADLNGIKISFYGSELFQRRLEGDLFDHYLSLERDTTYLFFTIRQFINSNNLLRTSYLFNILSTGVSLHFANESFSIKSSQDIVKLSLLLSSIKFSYFSSEGPDIIHSSLLLSAHKYLDD